jgi:hypothetical protein
MDLTLCDCDPMKNGDGMLLHKGREFALLDQLADLGVSAALPVMVMVTVFVLVLVQVAMLVGVTMLIMRVLVLVIFGAVFMRMSFGAVIMVALSA